MDIEIKKFQEAFNEVKSKGFIKTNRSGNTGIGKTLEDALGIVENNIDAPDLHGFEIKSQRALSTSYVTLFTRAPCHPRAANNDLRLKFGTKDSHFPDIKVLHVSLFANRWTDHSGGYSFKLQCDDANRRLKLLVREKGSDALAVNDIYWRYEMLSKIVTEKIQRLAFVQAEHVTKDNFEFFHFQKCSLFYGLDLSRFLKHLNTGDIMFDIRIGAYKTVGDAKYGKMHDHGSGFRIRKENMSVLYENHLSL